jgi:beta-phosphoglucomutase
MQPPYLSAVLFDLDGVITDTAEYHYLAWKSLADELGIPFTRADNEKLRGVSRRESLELVLDRRPATEAEKQTWMQHKNDNYLEMLQQVTPKDLLPGVAEILAELRAAGIKIAVASTSKNSPEVVEKLGIGAQLDTLVHSGHVARAKPAPDLFLHAAQQLGVPPGQCLVIEDAEAGIEAAHAAGMAVVGLGPHERVGTAELVLPNLEGATLNTLRHVVLWRVAESGFSAENQHHHETVFTIGNGYLSTRGTFEERYARDTQATFIHGIYDDRPITFTELANAPDWAAFEIWVNNQRFSIQDGYIQNYTRWLDLRTGTLHRRLTWASLSGNPIDIHFERFTSLADEHLSALRVTLTPLDGTVHIKVHATLDGHVENHHLLHWNFVSQKISLAHQADLVVRTRHTEKTVAMRMHLLALGTETGGEIQFAANECPGRPGIEVQTSVSTGNIVQFDKLVAIYTSRDTSDPLKAAQESLNTALEKGFDSLALENKKAWESFWNMGDVIIDGDDEAQLALRHGLFQLRIAAPTNDHKVSIGAKTLSGFAYAGHVFWDNEIFVLPFFTFTHPTLARNMLGYRFHTLPGARAKAAGNGYAGAQYAWESAETGDEVTPTWIPHFNDRTKLIRIWTGDIQYHISADVAYAMHQYWQVTGDDEFWRMVGVPVVLETAVFWGERAEPEGDRASRPIRFSIRDVIGCDEYHDHVDNNAFTNAMVQWHLRTALAALDWLKNHDPAGAGELISRLDLTPKRLAHWREVIDGLVLLHDPKTGLIEQFEGFFDLKDVDWPAFEGRTKSMQVLLGIDGANEHKVLKQADVIALLVLSGDRFDEKTWQANWDYYVPITDHTYGSSLGPAMHAWAACRMNQPEVAYKHFMRAARADLLDIRGNAAEGIHAASAGGMWEAVVFGFAGLNLTSEGLLISPRLPSHWKRVRFNILYQGECKQFDIGKEGGEPID